jgi:hypothetical protein
MKFRFDEAPAGFRNGHIEYKEKLLLIYNGFDSGGMIKFTVFFKANTDLLNVPRFHLTVKLTGNRPGDNFKRIGLEKRTGRTKISCVAYGFLVSIIFNQGIEPQGYGFMPYPAVCGDGFLGMGYIKRNARH